MPLSNGRKGRKKKMSSSSSSSSLSPYSSSSSKTTILDLMEELLLDIFSRLPIKSVIQCKSVSKPWRTLLALPSFVKLHFNRSKLRNPNLILRTLKKIENEDPLTSLLAFHSANSEFLHQVVKLNIYLHQREFSTIRVDSCNGLICLSDCQSFMSMWNPCTREHVHLHFPPISDIHNDIARRRLYMVCMGFGYDPIHDDYKVVRVSFHRFKCVQVLVYTLSRNSWRTIDDALPLPFSPGQGVHVNGVLHWKNYFIFGNESNIISFDLTTEEFGELRWSSGSKSNRRHLCVWQGYLAELRTFSRECVDLWIMKDYGVRESWTRMFSIDQLFIDSDFQAFHSLVHLNNGAILLLGEKWPVGNEKTPILYDPANKTATLLHCPLKVFDMIPYVENLTSIASLMAGSGTTLDR